MEVRGVAREYIGSNRIRTAGCLFATESGEKRWIKPTAAGRSNGYMGYICLHWQSVSLPKRKREKRDWFPLGDKQIEFTAVSCTFHDGPFPSATSAVLGRNVCGLRSLICGF